jgi:hypothetical protein
MKAGKPLIAQSVLGLSVGTVPLQTALKNLRNLRIWRKFAFQYPVTNHQESISGNTPVCF